MAHNTRIGFDHLFKLFDRYHLLFFVPTSTIHILEQVECSLDIVTECLQAFNSIFQEGSAVGGIATARRIVLGRNKTVEMTVQDVLHDEREISPEEKGT